MGASYNFKQISVRALTDSNIQKPGFQRDLCWTIDKKVKLIDSLYRGFPLPNFFIWRPTDNNTQWLLDGQQRHNAITGLRSVENEDEDGYDVYFDPASEQFTKIADFAPSRTQRGTPKLLVRDIWTDDGLDNALQDHAWTTIQRDRIRKVNKILDAQIYIVEIEANQEDAVELFVRLNMGGKILTAADIKIAELVGGGRETTVVEKIRTHLNTLKSDRFARINANHLLQASAALAGCDPAKGLGEASEPAVARAMQRLDVGISKTRELLKTELGIEDMSVLLSGALMVPLIVALGASRRVTADLNLGLTQWIAWAALKERYARSSGSRLREDIEAAASDDPVDAMLRLVRPRINSRAKPEDFEKPFQNKFALLAAFIATGHSDRRDFIDGTKISGSCSYEWHHIMPKATLRNTPAAPGANTIANLAFIKSNSNRTIAATPAEEYLPKISKTARASHCIPETNFSVSNAEAFWELRRKLLAKSFNDFLDSK